MNSINLKNKKDLLFYIGLSIIGIGFIYYIFFVDGKENQQIKQSASLISELPDGNIEPLKDKKEAYEADRYESSRIEKMKSLNDYMFDLTQNPNSEESNVEASDFLTGVNQGVDVVGSLQATLNTTNKRIYEDFDNLAIENERLNYEIERLRKEKKENPDADLQREKLELMKQIVQTQIQPQIETSPEIVDEHADAVEVSLPEKEVVTTLADELYLDMPYNAGFITAVGTGYETGKNTIKACVYEEVTVMDGERVMLKLLEPLQAGSILIPKNQLVAGTARIKGDRLDIIISSIEYSGNIIPVHLKVYDTDGVNGIYCPGSAELSAAKEAAANASSGIGSISVARGAGQQIAMDASRAIMQSGSQLLSRKMRTIKVTLKANYQVLLLPQK